MNRSFRAVAAATPEAAKLMGASDLIGTIEAGKQADLMLRSGDPLTDVRNARSPLGVMVRGRWLPDSELRSLPRGARQP